LDIHVYWNILTMHGPINVKSPNNTSKWQMGFNSAFKGLIYIYSSIQSFTVIHITPHYFFLYTYHARYILYITHYTVRDLRPILQIYWFLSFYILGICLIMAINSFRNMWADSLNSNVVFWLRNPSIFRIRIWTKSIVKRLLWFETWQGAAGVATNWNQHFWRIRNEKFT
jgi:hypothetical protein